MLYNHMNKYVKMVKDPVFRLYLTEVVNNHDKDSIKKIQKTLRDMGKRLEVDGDIGPITIAAIESVDVEKLAKNILETEVKLPHNVPEWIEAAFHELGVKEISGSGSNPRVEQYHDAVGIPWAKDDVPWCASFVGFCMLKAGYQLPKNPYRALSWLTFGVSAGKPVFGAIAVKKRKGGGHVTFVVGRKGEYLYCLGGNQHDAVNVAVYHESVFEDFRIPNDYAPTMKLSEWKGVSSIAGKES